MVENIDIANEIHAMSRMRFQSDFGLWILLVMSKGTKALFA